jgi:hypothetical protein
LGSITIKNTYNPQNIPSLGEFSTMSGSSSGVMMFSITLMGFSIFIHFYFNIYHNRKMHRSFVYVVNFYFLTNLEKILYGAQVQAKTYTLKK